MTTSYQPTETDIQNAKVRQQASGLSVVDYLKQMPADLPNFYYIYPETAIALGYSPPVTTPEVNINTSPDPDWYALSDALTTVHPDLKDSIWEFNYKKALNMGKEDEDAIKYADNIINNVLTISEDAISSSEYNQNKKKRQATTETTSSDNALSLIDQLAQLQELSGTQAIVPEPLPQEDNIRLTPLEMLAYKTRSTRLWSLRKLPIDQIAEIYANDYEQLFLASLTAQKPKRKYKRQYRRHY